MFNGLLLELKYYTLHDIKIGGTGAFNMSRVPMLEKLPQLTEVVVDTGIGTLIIFLFGPYLYVASRIARQGLDGELLISIFPDFWSLFKTIGLGTGLMGIFLAFVVGICSRGIIVAYNFVPGIKLMEKGVIKAALHQVKKWHGLPGRYSDDFIMKHLVKKTPFHKVGKKKYAKFRSELINPKSSLNKFKSYWDHEEFLYLRSSHLYRIFMTFFISYSIYGVLLIILNSAFKCGLLSAQSILIWILALGLTIILIISLFEEVIIHGVAFISIENILYEKFGEASEKNSEA